MSVTSQMVLGKRVAADSPSPVTSTPCYFPHPKEYESLLSCKGGWAMRPSSVCIHCLVVASTFPPDASDLTFLVNRGEWAL